MKFTNSFPLLKMPRLKVLGSWKKIINEKFEECEADQKQKEKEIAELRP